MSRRRETPEQTEAFCRLIASGSTATQALREANPGATERWGLRTLHEKARLLRQRPDIAVRIVELRNELGQPPQQDPCKRVGESTAAGLRSPTVSSAPAAVAVPRVDQASALGGLEDLAGVAFDESADDRLRLLALRALGVGLQLLTVRKGAPELEPAGPSTSEPAAEMLEDLSR